MARELRRRPLWVTVPLYAVGLVIVGLDVWSVVFWSAVGASLGMWLAVTGGAVALVLGGLLVLDARRQWLLGRTESEQP